MVCSTYRSKVNWSKDLKSTFDMWLFIQLTVHRLPDHWVCSYTVTFDTESNDSTSTLDSRRYSFIHPDEAEHWWIVLLGKIKPWQRWGSNYGCHNPKTCILFLNHCTPINDYTNVSVSCLESLKITETLNYMKGVFQLHKPRDIVHTHCFYLCVQETGTSYIVQSKASQQD